jgi:hypothetical protein
MRGLRFGIVLVALAVALGACAGPWPIMTGNDTGGIISWSPATEAEARAMAGNHCSQYGRVARITSVGRREYGDYIGFACL